jgi:predicted RNase H-like HicB family nuclease
MTVSTARAEDDPDTITVSGGESTDSFVAKDEATGVVSQGKTKVEALVNLADALELYHQSNSEESEPNLSTAPWF